LTALARFKNLLGIGFQSSLLGTQARPELVRVYRSKVALHIVIDNLTFVVETVGRPCSQAKQ